MPFSSLHHFIFFNFTIGVSSEERNIGGCTATLVVNVRGVLAARPPLNEDAGGNRPTTLLLYYTRGCYSITHLLCYATTCFHMGVGHFCKLLPLKWTYFKEPKLYYIKLICWVIWSFDTIKMGAFFEKSIGTWRIFLSIFNPMSDFGTYS